MKLDLTTARLLVSRTFNFVARAVRRARPAAQQRLIAARARRMTRLLKHVEI